MYVTTTVRSSTSNVSPDTLYLDELLTKPIPVPTAREMYVVQGALLIYNDETGYFEVDYDFETREEALIKKLSLYHVNEDTKADKQDNILLKLKNSASDIATIRIYNAGSEDEPIYKIQSIVVRASHGVPEDAQTYNLNNWIKGNLSSSVMDLNGYKITYIGTMGAYFVLAKDEVFQPHPYQVL